MQHYLPCRLRPCSAEAAIWLDSFDLWHYYKHVRGNLEHKVSYERSQVFRVLVCRGPTWRRSRLNHWISAVRTHARARSCGGRTPKKINDQSLHSNSCNCNYTVPTNQIKKKPHMDTWCRSKRLISLWCANLDVILLVLSLFCFSISWSGGCSSSAVHPCLLFQSSRVKYLRTSKMPSLSDYWSCLMVCSTVV